jgi:hypothetical protein
MPYRGPHGLWTKAKPLASPEADGFAVLGQPYSAALWNTRERSLRLEIEIHDITRELLLLLSEGVVSIGHT